MTLRVAFAGTPAFAVAPLRALQAAHHLVGVLTQPDRPAGRGRALAASPVKQAALEARLPLAQPARLRGDASRLEATLAQLRAWAPDVIVVVAYGLLLPRELLTLPRLGCLNIHASLLPRWRGAAPVQRAILAGDAETGISIMQMDEGLDSGPVLARAGMAIGAETTAAQLFEQLAALGAAQIVAALEGFAAGTLHAQPQPAAGATYAPKLAKSAAPLDWCGDAVRIDRQIRAFNPWPVAETRLAGETVKLLRSRVDGLRAAPAGAAPGALLGLHGDALEVACGNGVVQLLELQRAGRKPVGARDFHNALHLPAGARAEFG
ncbi:MAG TPA: methionyl-tRNA formyltransferase [Steroidobacteraceae bacterium]|nr:methionyl-tRNA formyltransferase [Steroidobacteraceae bacterium]